MLLKEPMTLAEASRKAKRVPKLYLRPDSAMFAKVATMSLKEFIKAFFTEYNGGFPVLKKSTNQPQTSPGRRRSAGDVWRLCQEYFPECTLEEVRNIMIDLVNEKVLATFICHDIKKRVFLPNNHIINWRTQERGISIVDAENRDEYGWKFTKKAYKHE